MTKNVPQYEDHSLKGYLMRQPVRMLKGELAKLLLLEKEEPLCDYDLSVKVLLIEVLRLRGEGAEIDLSTVYYTSPYEHKYKFFSKP